MKKNYLCVAGIVFLFFFGLVWMMTTASITDIKFDNEEPESITGEWEINYGDSVLHTSLPTVIDANTNEWITMETVLDDKQVSGNSLLFYAKLADVRVYLDGEVIIEREERSLPFPMAPGSAWHFARLTEDWSGKTLKIEMISPMKEGCKELPEVYIGTKASFIYMIIKQGLWAFILCLPIAMAGVVFIIISLLLKSRIIRSRLFFLGLLALVISCWNVLESRMSQLVTGNLYVAIYILFSCFFMIPVLIISFLLTFQIFRRSKLMRGLFWAAAITYVAVQVLQMTGKVYYLTMVPVVHLFLGIIAADIVVIFIRIKKQRAMKKEESAMFSSILIFAAFVLIDVLRFYCKVKSDAGRFSRLGLLIFIVSLGYAGVRQASELMLQEARENIYRELAFTDILTGLPNRTAFEGEMKRHREGKETEQLIIMVSDLNSLKYINDNFGHIRGDEAIRLTADCLRESFEESSCFRIGGDEFCVMISDILPEAFQKKFENFRGMIEEKNKNLPYRFSVACGYYETTNTDIDEGFKTADMKMYESKKKYKQEDALIESQSRTDC